MAEPILTAAELIYFLEGQCNQSDSDRDEWKLMTERLQRVIKHHENVGAELSCAPCESDRQNLVAALALPQQKHSDDTAVDLFCSAMKSKLSQKRAEGRGGWEDPSVTGMKFLVHMLMEHVDKGDPVDVANFAMMIWNRQESGNG